MQTVPEIMYRTEDTYGSGVRNITDIIQHEIFELSNIDILCYIKNNYVDRIISQDSYKFTIQTINELIDNGGVSKSLNNIRLEKGNDVAEKTFVNSLLYIIKIITTKNIKYGLWLADKNTVKTYYESNNIDAYKTSSVILSDLGDEGILFGYEDMPQPINEDALSEEDVILNQLKETLRLAQNTTITLNRHIEKAKNKIEKKASLMFHKYANVIKTIIDIEHELHEQDSTYRPQALTDEKSYSINAEHNHIDNKDGVVMSIKEKNETTTMYFYIDEIHIDVTNKHGRNAIKCTITSTHDIKIENALTRRDEIKALMCCERCFDEFPEKINAFAKKIIQTTKNLI